MASDRDGTGLRSLAEASASPGLPKAPTGIRGLDAITEASLRATPRLVTGGTGSGMTLLGLLFLAAGAREHGEPGVFVTFVRHRPDAPRSPSLGPPRDRREGGFR